MHQRSGGEHDFNLDPAEVNKVKENVSGWVLIEHPLSEVTNILYLLALVILPLVLIG